MYGNLNVYAGPMFSGKTSALLKEYLWLTQYMSGLVLIKPSFDNRYSEIEVATHNGVKIKAHSVNSEDQIFMLAADADYVFIDEVQFFTSDYFQSELPFHLIVKRLLSEGIHVQACGLDMDYRGNPFEITANLLAMADFVQKLESKCAISGNAASKTYKKTNSDNRYELGETDIYEPRSNKHWSPK